MALWWWSLEAPLVLLATSTVLVAASAVAASAPQQPALLAWVLADLDLDDDDDELDDDRYKRRKRGVVLGMPAVMIYPLLASIVLLGLYWFAAYVSWLLLLSHVVSGVFGMSVGLDAAILLLVLLLPGCSNRASGGSSGSTSTSANSPVTVGESSVLQSRICAAIAIMCVLAWIWTNSTVLANVIAMSLCITMASLIRVQSLKVITMMLAALFFYDIFWVFFSADLFGANVMVEVAAQAAPNPLQELLPVMKNAARELEPPVKLVYGGMMLGLGDIALPALLASLSRRIDLSLERLTPARYGVSYLTVTVASYFVGLLLCMVALLVYNVAQPALLYIVPVMLGAVLCYARARGELERLWHQPIGTPASSSHDASNRV